MANPGEVIFFRAESTSSINSEMSNEDIWDDKILINLYDKAINVANEEVAKRLAMITNTSAKQKLATGKGKPFKSRWKVGSKVRSTYSEDNREYEATIIKLIDKNTCTVRYIGYENEEDVELRHLFPSLGECVRALQVIEAKGYMEEQKQKLAKEKKPDFDAIENVTASSPAGSSKPKKNKKGPKNKQKQESEFSLPLLNSFPFPMNMNLDCEIPLPPPPVLPPINTGSSEEDQSLSTMLISWYMSGYYTGLYLGQKMARRELRG